MLSINSCGMGDNHPTYSCIDSSKGIFYLREHASADGSAFFISHKIFMSNGGDDSIVVIRITEYSFLLKSEDECHIIMLC